MIRNKSILVLHIAELRTEKLKLESSFEMNVADDLIDYPALVEKFIDDQRVLDLIPKLVHSLTHCREFAQCKKVDCKFWNA